MSPTHLERGHPLLNLICISSKPLSSPPIADAYSSTAIITWSPASDCVLFNVYILSGSFEVLLNNGEGLHLTTPTITAINVSVILRIFVKSGANVHSLIV